MNEWKLVYILMISWLRMNSIKIQSKINKSTFTKKSTKIKKSQPSPKESTKIQKSTKSKSQHLDFFGVSMQDAYVMKVWCALGFLRPSDHARWMIKVSQEHSQAMYAINGCNQALGWMMCD